MHAVLVLVANVSAFWLRFDGQIPEPEMKLLLRLLPWLVVIRLASFLPFRLFEGLWRYTSLWDLRRILLGVALSTSIFYPIAAISGGGLYPRSVFVVDALLLVFFMSGTRLTRRIYSETFRSLGGRRVLVYGAGDAGELIVRDMLQNARFHAVPIGFIDDDYRKAGRRIHGVPVLGGREQLEKIFKSHAPEELLLALPSASRETLREIVRMVEPYHVRITTLPKLHDLIGVSVDVEQIRQLKVEDLLSREPVGLDHRPVQEFLQGKRVVVTGAGGSIGSELCRQIAAARPRMIILVEQYENALFHIYNEITAAFPDLELYPAIADITDLQRINQLFEEMSPQVVFHAAAHKHVPLMECNACEAVKNNVRGTRVVVEAALKHGAERFVLISTDKAVRPTSVMGATKRVGELIVDDLSRTHGTRLATVRFGNVLGSNGSVVPTFVSQIASGGPVKVTHPQMRRYFMLIPEAVQLVLHAGAAGDQASLFVLEMGEQVKVVDMARDLIRLSGFVPDKDIQIEFTGVRPGEKLFEELVGDGEVSEPSSVDKILRVRTGGASKPYSAQQVERLEALAIEGRSGEVMQQLQFIVPEFNPPPVAPRS